MKHIRSSNDTITSLQALRACAALLVVLYHMGLSNYQTKNAYFTHFFNFGFSGVDIFFVLSGFIIYYSTIRKPNLTAFEFLLRRLIRIFPIYWVAIIATLAAFSIQIFYPTLFTSHQLVYDAVKTGGAAFILNSFLLLPFAHPSLLAVSWTLSFEMLFYLLFGLFFFRSKKLFLVILVFWVCACFFALPIYHINYFSNSSGAFLPVLNPIVSEFLFGCFVAILAVKNNHAYSKTALILGVIFFSISVIAHAEGNVYSEFSYGLPAAFIIYGFSGMQFNIPSFFTYLGDASYSIYIFHVPMLSFLGKSTFLFEKIGNTSASILILIAIVLISCLIHSYIENPLLKFFRKKLLPYKEKKVIEIAELSPT